jgi:hypothetical protein
MTPPTAVRLVTQLHHTEHLLLGALYPVQQQPLAWRPWAKPIVAPRAARGDGASAAPAVESNGSSECKQGYGEAWNSNLSGKDFASSNSSNSDIVCEEADVSIARSALHAHGGPSGTPGPCAYELFPRDFWDERRALYTAMRDERDVHRRRARMRQIR